MAQLDIAELAARLAGLGVSSVKPLSGGASSLTYRGERDGRPVVVKVAPPALPPVLHRDVLRQARALRALAPTDVPVPEVLAEDPGDPPAVPPLFIMTLVPGQSIEPLFDLDIAGSDPAAPDTPTMAARLQAAAKVMASLHRLDPNRLGLADQVVVDAESEIDRWCRLFATVDQTLVPGWEDVAARLRYAPPPAIRPAIVHGDFRLGNLLAVGSGITAVIDWEIWSLGDPRVDVGWFLANAEPATYKRSTRYTGNALMPTPEHLTQIYHRALGREDTNLGWFVALARFKSAATWSLIIKHNRRQATPDPGTEAMAATPGDLLEQARIRAT